MTWQRLADRLDSLPLVLAGPILRKTTTQSVTVWVALRKMCNVTLKVFEIPAPGSLLLRFEGVQTPIIIGKNLYITAVTAQAQSSVVTLSSGKIYGYQLEFEGFGDLDTVGVLNEKGDISTIAYSPYSLPTFSLPPTSLSMTRLFHGSCRKPHITYVGNIFTGYFDLRDVDLKDALAILDGKIAENVTLPDSRPHQLFLTGDQIYADDVADCLLHMLIDAGNTLLAWNSPEVTPDTFGVTSDDLRAGRREWVSWAKRGGEVGVSSLESKSQLILFAEFCAMYLFVWSTVLWPSDLPSFADVFPQDKTGTAVERLFKIESFFVSKFKLQIPAIRKALANVAVYMICDDHEVSDDWYLNLRWCRRALAISNDVARDVGMRIIQNGLLAYAVFQGWGNTPESFKKDSDGHDVSAGAKLLTNLFQWSLITDRTASHEDELRDLIRQNLGIPTLQEVVSASEIPHPDAAIAWHYTVSTTNYNVVVLDTRTWRSFKSRGEKDGCESGISDAAVVMRPTSEASAVRCLRRSERGVRAWDGGRSRPESGDRIARGFVA